MTSALAARDVLSPQEKKYGMVEVPLLPATASWQKSRACNPDAANCLETTSTQGHVWVRDSKNPFGPALGFTREGWSAFLTGVQRDEFTRPGAPA